jgi:hypothetical protein
MAHFRLVALIVFITLSMPLETRAQAEPDKKQQEAVQKALAWLIDHHIESKQLPNQLPLLKFLEAVQKQLPKEKKLSLQIDKDAFGAGYDAIAATPITLPAGVNQPSVRFLLDIAAAKIKADYRIDGGAVTITTRERAVFMAEYDLRELIAKPEVVGLADPAFRNADAATKGTLVVKRLLTALEHPTEEVGESYQILNGTRLVIRATGTRQVQFASAVRTFARLGDLALITTAKLYEVDDSFYTKLKNVKYVPLEELERIFLEGKQPKGNSLHDLLPKQKLIVTGDEVKVDNRRDALLLARQGLIRCLPSPEQILKGETARQTILEGVSFHANFQVTPDRRFVQVKLTERVAELVRIQKVKVPPIGLRTIIEEFGKGAPEKDVFGEVAVVKETTQVRTLDLADGGSILVPVHYRPRSAQDANRWCVLLFTTRIYIEEEERLIREGAK